jgi:hypothetical protein
VSASDEALKARCEADAKDDRNCDNHCGSAGILMAVLEQLDTDIAELKSALHHLSITVETARDTQATLERVTQPQPPAPGGGE